MSFYTNVYLKGNTIYYRGIDDNKKRVAFKETFEPTLYTPTDEQSTFKTLYGENVKPKKFDNVSDARNFLKQYEGSYGYSVHGFERYLYQYISDKFKGEIDFDPTLVRKHNIDIEVASDDGFPEPETALYPITAITVLDSYTNEYEVWAFGDYKVHRTDIKINFHKCKDEIDLMEKYIAHFKENTPDIITGWNNRFFDIPYIVNRTRNILGSHAIKSLSPWGMVNENNIDMGGKKIQTYDLVGVSILDGLEMYKKYTYSSQESFRLDYISHIELGEKKISYEEAGSLFNLYKTNHQKFIEYNIKDVELVEKIDEKNKFIDLVISMAYMAKVNYNDVYAPVKLWEIIIYNHLKKDNIVMPAKAGFSDKSGKYAGAYVKEPTVGKHNWVVSFDLASLYPSIVRQWNISPETVVQPRSSELLGETMPLSIEEMIDGKGDFSHYLKDENITMAANKKFYTREKQGFLPEIFTTLFNERKVIKRKMLDKMDEKEHALKENRASFDGIISALKTKQMALKILLNSAYGAIGNQYFRFYSIDNAEAITITGQLVIQWIETRLNVYFNELLKTDNVNYVIAIDTDSNYICLDKLVEVVFKDKDVSKEEIVNFLDKCCAEKIEPFINARYAELAEYINAYEDLMVMEREVIADVGIWTAKKRYILNVYDNEGVRYAKPKIKITGIEAVRSSTPAVCREKIKECLDVIINKTEDDTIDFIEDFRNKFDSYEAHEVATPSSANNLIKYSGQGNRTYIKGTPMQVKGSLIYNMNIDRLKLDKQYQKIKESDKVKVCLLKEPNPFGERVISMPDFLPKEMGLDNYIDYDGQFQKGFLSPIENILHAIGWKSERKGDLRDIFGF